VVALGATAPAPATITLDDMTPGDLAPGGGECGDLIRSASGGTGRRRLASLPMFTVARNLRDAVGDAGAEAWVCAARRLVAIMDEADTGEGTTPLARKRDTAESGSHRPFTYLVRTPTCQYVGIGERVLNMTVLGSWFCTVATLVISASAVGWK
jgi:hypothetical protein